MKGDPTIEIAWEARSRITGDDLSCFLPDSTGVTFAEESLYPNGPV